jgi:hypothetical protein
MPILAVSRRHLGDLALEGGHGLDVLDFEVAAAGF